MPSILPFRGIRYDENVAGKLERLISPPYDVIDADMYQALIQASPFNVGRLILAGSPVHGAITDETTYAVSRRFFEEWRQRGILKKDPAPAFYIYEQDFRVGGKTYTRTGLVALVNLVESSGSIRPHEHTLTGPKADRLNLLRATRVNFGQIFVLYDDASGSAVELLKDCGNSRLIGEAVDGDGISHRIRMITSPEKIIDIRRLLGDVQLLIADGHHRFETSLNYMKEHPDSPAARYCMMTLVSMKDPGLQVLPTHRLVRNLPGFNDNGLLMKLERKFNVAPVECGRDDVAGKMRTELRARQKGGEIAFGLYLSGGASRIISARRAAVKAGGDACAALDVSVLHSQILDEMLGIGGERLAGGGHIEYIKDFDNHINKAISDVDSGRSNALFFLNPPLVEDVAAVAAQGGRMPQKSTFFYPKVFTGLIMRALDDAEILEINSLFDKG